MFSKPKHGWTNWEINGHEIGRISYIEPVPEMFIEACVKYIHDPWAFNLFFDAEGYEIGITKLGDVFVSYDTLDEDYFHNIAVVYDDFYDVEFVKDMLREAIEDFERDFDDWVMWDAVDEVNVKAERELLSSLIKHGKKALKYREPELGNLLFGNSRGEYPVQRELIQDIWYETFRKFLDGYGYLQEGVLEKFRTNRGGFENDIFLVNPYYWGVDEEVAAEHNFVYKPENICIDWYKYPMRDAYSNIELSPEKATEIFGKCVESMRKAIQKGVL